MMKKKHTTIVYIDGFNFYYGLLKKSAYKWLNLQTLFEDLFHQQNDIIKIKYFTARVDPTSHDPYVQQRQDAYIRALKHSCPKVEIHYGHFLRHKVKMEKVSPPPDTVYVWKNEEKGSDVNLAVHLLNDAWTASCECAIVLPRMEMNRRLRYNKVDSPPKERIVWDSSVDVLVRSRR